MSEPLLYVSDLSVRYSKRREVTTALRDVSFSLGKEIVTIIRAIRVAGSPASYTP